VLGHVEVFEDVTSSHELYNRGTKVGWMAKGKPHVRCGMWDVERGCQGRGRGRRAVSTTQEWGKSMPRTCGSRMDCFVGGMGQKPVVNTTTSSSNPPGNGPAVRKCCKTDSTQEQRGTCDVTGDTKNLMQTWLGKPTSDERETKNTGYTNTPCGSCSACLWRC
jgi:hypothetical protein